MRKILLFFMLLSIAVAGAWIYFANKFEQIVVDDILPKLTQNPEIVYVDPSAVRIQKYRFELSLGKLEILPDHEKISVTLNDTGVKYNPFKDEISLYSIGNKNSFVIEENEYYTNNLKIGFEFKRPLLQGVVSDFGIKFEFADSELYEATNNTKVANVAGGEVRLTYRQNDGYITPQIKLDFKDLYISEQLSDSIANLQDYAVGNLLPQFIGSFNLNIDGRRNFHNGIDDYMKKLSGTDKLQYSFTLDANIDNAIADQVAEAIMYPDLPKIIQIVDSKKFDFYLNQQMSLGLFSNSTDFSIGKKDDYLEVKINTSSNQDLNDGLRAKLSIALAEVYDNWLQDIYRLKGLSPEDYLNLSKAFASVKNTDMNGYINYGMKDSSIKHDINISVNTIQNNYKFKSKGDYSNNKYAANIQCDQLGTGMLVITDISSDLLGRFNKKATNVSDETKKILLNIEKVMKFINQNGFEVIKVLHKGGEDDLTLDGTFESDIAVDTSNMSVEINAVPINQVMLHPAIDNFMAGMFQQLYERD